MNITKFIRCLAQSFACLRRCHRKPAHIGASCHPSTSKTNLHQAGHRTTNTHTTCALPQYTDIDTSLLFSHQPVVQHLHQQQNNVNPLATDEEIRVQGNFPGRKIWRGHSGKWQEQYELQTLYSRFGMAFEAVHASSWLAVGQVVAVAVIIWWWQAAWVTSFYYDTLLNLLEIAEYAKKNGKFIDFDTTDYIQEIYLQIKDRIGDQTTDSKMYNVGKGSALNMEFHKMVGAGDMINDAIWYLQTAQQKSVYTSLMLKAPTEKRGLLLVGPPGNGKTLLVRGIAGESGVPTIVISGSVLQSTLSSQSGMGGKQLQQIFNRAREQAPCIVFIDELDSIGTKRSMLTESLLGSGQSMGSRTLADILPSTSDAKRFKDGLLYAFGEKNTSATTQKQKQNYTEQITSMMQLLMELDGLQGMDGVLVIGATNREWTVDEALLRPGRFDKKLYVGKPDWDKRRNILKFYCWPVGVDDSGVSGVGAVGEHSGGFVKVDHGDMFDYLADRTHDYSAAELAGLMRRSVTCALMDYMNNGCEGQVSHTLKTLETGRRRVGSAKLTAGGDKNEQAWMDSGFMSNEGIPDQLKEFEGLGELVRLQESVAAPEISKHQPLNGSLWWRSYKYSPYTFLEYNTMLPWHLDLPLWSEYQTGANNQSWVPPDRYVSTTQHYGYHARRVRALVQCMKQRADASMAYRQLHFYYMFCAFDEYREMFDIQADKALRYPV